MADRGRKLFSVEEAIEAFFTDQDSDNDNFDCGLLNIVLIVKMSQLMKKMKMTWKTTALFYPLQSLARMVKLFQMTKKVIVLPPELCRKFHFLDLASKKIYITCFFICIYCIAGKHVTDSDLQPVASSSSLRQQSAALSQPSTSKRPIEKIDKRRKKRKLNEDIQVTKISVSNLQINIIFM